MLTGHSVTPWQLPLTQGRLSPISTGRAQGSPLSSLDRNIRSPFPINTIKKTKLIKK